MLLFVFGIILPFRTDYFVLEAAYLGNTAFIGSYKLDIWENEPSAASTFIRFYNVEPSTDGNLSLSLIENKNTMIGSTDLYFSFDYGEFYITPFEYYTDYLTSGYQYAPFQTLGSGNMLGVADGFLYIIDKGNLTATFTLSQLYNTFTDFQYLYIIQLVNTNDYYAAFNEGHSAGYNQGYNLGFNEGKAQGLNEGYNNGYQDGYNLGSSVGYSRGYTAGLDDGEVIGYNQGYSVGYGDGEVVGYNDGYDYGYNNGYDLGFDDGYQAAVNDGSADFGIKSLMSGLFVGLGSLLSIELLPNISIGMIVAVPVVFGIIAFILGKRGGGD